jgi:DNA-binding transcriptional LysR family regulator
MAVPENWYVRARVKAVHLRLLNALGRHRNLHRAAEEIGIAQPAATKLIRDLEYGLGLPLFSRSRRGTVATEFGEIMIRDSTVLLARLDRTRDDLDAASRGISGLVKIGTHPATAPLIIPLSVSLLLAQGSRVRISIDEMLHEHLTVALQRGDLDLIVARVFGVDDRSDLQYEPLYREEFRVVCGRNHALARIRRLSLADLEDETWIVPPSSTPLRAQFDEAFVTARLEPPRSIVESVSIYSNQVLLDRTNALCLMPSEICEHLASLELVRIIPIRLPSIHRWIAIIRRKNEAPTAAQEAVTSALRMAVKTLRRNKIAATP